MKITVHYLWSMATLFAMAPGAHAADPAAAMQPSTERVISHADMKKVLARPDDTVILDVRRNSDYDKDMLTMPAAQRFDPDKVTEWSAALPKDKEILGLHGIEWVILDHFRLQGACK